MNWQKLGRRFAFYLLGVGLGSILVWFTLIKGRTDLPDMWPQGRVRDMFARAQFQPDSLSFCWLNCFKATPKDLSQFIQTAQVRFGQSKPRETPKIYVLEGPLFQKEVRAGLAIQDSVYWLRSLEDLSLPQPLTCVCP
jgi:hypothetical protein